MTKDHVYVGNKNKPGSLRIHSSDSVLWWITIAQPEFRYAAFTLYRTSWRFER